MAIEVWFLPSVIALTIWGVTGFLSKIALKSLPPLHLLVYGALFFLTTALLVQVFYGGPEFHVQGVTLALCVGAAGSVGQLMFLLALRDGPLTYVSMISSLYPLIATILAFVLLGEPLTPRQMAGVAMGIFAIVLLVVSRDKQPS
jgi:transporter family protein